MSVLHRGSENLVGSMVSHYRVLEDLGGGAMGRVFRGEDTRLKRPVALKFLPAGWSGDREAKRRFVREARSASAIDHPNICTVFEIDETEHGELFIVMPYYAGETLKKKIAGRPLRWRTAVGYAEQSLRGLAKAHERGIVHRDIKPANLMVTEDGVLKIVDFGLAKLAGEARVTEIGQAMGTVAYMSPEQTLGRELDPRSDLWSCGVVLFEALTGRCPFGGEPVVAMEAIRSAEPLQLTELRASAPKELERIVQRALTKSRRRRYQSAAEMLAELGALRRSAELADGATMPYSLPPPAPAWRRAPWTTALVLLVVLIAVVGGLAILRSGGFAADPALPHLPPEGGRLRIGVLAPLVDPTATAPGDWPRLIQALLATELTGIDEFGVVEPLTLNGIIVRGFQSLQAPRGTEFYDHLSQADLDLALDGVLLGEAGSHVLIAKLIDLAGPETLFSTSLTLESSRTLSSGLHDLSEELLGHLQIQALGHEKRDELRPWISTRRHDIDALRAFLRATEYIYRFEEGSRAYLERALEIDPDFITARVWLISGMDSLEEAQPHYEYLLEIEDRASPFEQAMIRWAGALLADDVPGQIQHLEIALGHSPDNYILQANVADLRRQIGDCEGALRTLEPALEARWAFPALYDLAGRCLITLGRFDEARAGLEAALLFEPVHPGVLAMLEALSVIAGEIDSADAYWERYVARAREPVHGPTPVELASMYFKSGSHCLDRGRSRCAVRLLERAVQLDASDPLYRERLDVALSMR